MSNANVDVVRRAYEAFGRGDIDTLLDSLDPSVEWITPGPADFRPAGTRRGREAVRGFFGTIAGMFEFQSFEPHTFVAEGDHVVVLGRERVVVKPIGQVVESEWAHHLTVRNGKVTRFQEYIDTAAMVGALRAAETTA